MRVAFVGVKRKYLELPEDYRRTFTRFHLELPFYYQRDGMDVDVTTVDFDEGNRNVGDVRHILEGNLDRSHGAYDVVVHWRKWFDEFYVPGAVNVVNSQDHSYGEIWKHSVRLAAESGKLDGILCFPTWHRRKLESEMPFLDSTKFIDGLTLGVDTDVYHPTLDRDPFKMLWASDPGRGLGNAIMLAVKLFRRDRRFRLHICYPDYVQEQNIVEHPALVWHRNIKNGPELWDLFNTSSVLPYTSTFMEPSSRAHRQAQASGMLVLYPPNMGSPSELITSGKDGIVAPIDTWAATIEELIVSGGWKDYWGNARRLAEDEDWWVQSARFDGRMRPMIEGKKHGD